MLKDTVMCFTGFGSGILVAGGIVALIVGLGIVTRFEGIFHAASHNAIYEYALFFGALFGNGLTLFQVHVSAGRIGLLILGLMSGIYTGSWILALAELLHIFPVFAKNLHIRKGTGVFVISIALGKIMGSLLKFYMSW